MSAREKEGADENKPPYASVQEYDDQAYQNIYYVAESIDDAKVKLRLKEEWGKNIKANSRPTFHTINQNIYF